MFVYIFKSATQNERDGLRLMASVFSRFSLGNPKTEILKNRPGWPEPLSNLASMPCNDFPDGRDEAF